MRKNIKLPLTVDWLQLQSNTTDGFALLNYLNKNQIQIYTANIDNHDSGFVADREGLGELTEQYKTFFVAKKGQLYKQSSPLSDEDFDKLWEAANPNDEDLIIKPIVIIGNTIFIGFNTKLSKALKEALEESPKPHAYTQRMFWVPVFYNCTTEDFKVISDRILNKQDEARHTQRFYWVKDKDKAPIKYASYIEMITGSMSDSPYYDRIKPLWSAFCTSFYIKKADGPLLHFPDPFVSSKIVYEKIKEVIPNISDATHSVIFDGDTDQYTYLNTTSFIPYVSLKQLNKALPKHKIFFTCDHKNHFRFVIINENVKHHLEKNIPDLEFIELAEAYQIWDTMNR